MKRIASACVLVACAHWLTPVRDAHAAEVALRGASSCALWTKGRAQGDAKYEKAWLAGYFSGLAIALDVDFWGSKKADELASEAAWKWVDDYCAANPDSSLVKAAEKLFLERLPGRTK